MKYAFIINPTAGKKTKQKPFAEEVEKFFSKTDLEYEIFFTSAPNDAKNYATKLAKSGEPIKIFACGGEGTAFEVLNGIVGYDNVSLGVVPCGSANDFISYFSDHELFLDVAAQVNGEEVELDLIKVDGKYALNCCSIGLDATIANNMTKFKRFPFVSGKMSYVLSTLYTILGKIGLDLEVRVDDGEKVISKKSLFAVVSNATFYGGGFNPTPKASPFDEELDYCVISAVSRLRILSLLSKYRKGTHTNLDICDYGKAKKVTVTAKSKVPLNLDGEIFFVKSADFEIVPKAVKLILPSSIASVWKEKINKLNPVTV